MTHVKKYATCTRCGRYRELRHLRPTFGLGPMCRNTTGCIAVARIYSAMKQADRRLG